MVIVDTNILSTFARINKLDLLHKVTEASCLYITPAVKSELNIGLQKGLSFIKPILSALNYKQSFQIVELTQDEIGTLDLLPNSLNLGEKESISVCTHRKNCRIITNDKRAHNYCKTHQIPCLDLPRLLRRLWQSNIYTKAQVKSLLHEIEVKEPGFVIKNINQILK